MSKEDNDIIKEYKAYLDESNKLFGSKTPAQIRREAPPVTNTSAANYKYYYPESFLNGLLARGGMVPMMLYNSCEYAKRITPQELQVKLGYWEEIKAAYNHLLEDENNFGPKYKTWRAQYPGLTDGEAEAIYCAKLFQQQHMDYVAHAPFDGMFVKMTPTSKLHGDCDTKSYLVGCLLMQATDDDYKQVFKPTDLTFENFPHHVRLKIKDKYIYEAASTIDGREDPEFSRKEDAKDKSETVEKTTSSAFSIGKQFVSENLNGFNTKLKMEQKIILLRPFAIMDPQDPHMECSQLVHHRLANALLFKQEELRFYGAAIHNSLEIKQKFAEAYRGNKELIASIGEAQENDFQTLKVEAQERLQELRSLSPEDFAKLEAQQAMQNKQGTGNFVPYKPKQPQQAPSATQPR